MSDQKPPLPTSQQPAILHEALDRITSPSRDTGYTLVRLVAAPRRGVLRLTVTLRTTTREATATYLPDPATEQHLLALGTADTFLPEPPPLNATAQAMELIEPIAATLYDRAKTVLAAFDKPATCAVVVSTTGTPIAAYLTTGTAVNHASTINQRAGFALAAIRGGVPIDPHPDDLDTIVRRAHPGMP